MGAVVLHTRHCGLFWLIKVFEEHVRLATRALIKKQLGKSSPVSYTS